MNSGQTMERVYDALRRMITYGELPAGSRIDPIRLSQDLHTSATPVRDALHRLVGERIVLAWPQEGFHVPLYSESGLRDLYNWHSQIVQIILNNVNSSDTQGLAGLRKSDIVGTASSADAANALFRTFATASRNLEHHHSIANAAARLHLARMAEADVIALGTQEIAALEDLWLRNDLPLLRRSLKVYHRRRTAAVPALILSIRMRLDTDKTKPEL